MATAGHNAQNKLFPDVDTTYTVYEQPLNERIRNFLRLEYLFNAIAEALERDGVSDARGAIVNMIELCDLLSRVDIKGEFIKELERHITIMGGLRNNPSVNQATLEKTITSLEPLTATLRSNACQPGAKIRQSELINQIKQRIAMPGGTCSFDLPAFHHWLHKGPSYRLSHLNEWLLDLKVIKDATQTVLRLVRDSAMPRKISAAGGFYQQQLDASLPCQLVRVIVADTDDVFPEISGGKHRFTVRFFQQQNMSVRPQQVGETIWFELQCCGI